MKEIKDIDQLFKAAKEEVPQRTFEEVSKKFKHSLVPKTKIDFRNYFSNFNLFIMTIITIPLAVALYFGFSQSTEAEPKKTIPENFNTAIPKTIEPHQKFKSDIKENMTNESTEKMSSKNDSSKKRNTPVVDSSPDKDDFIAELDTPNSSGISVNQPIKTSNSVNVQREVINPKEVEIKSPKLSNTASDLLLSKTDKEEAINSFVNELESYGIETYIVINKKIKGVNKKITLLLTHREGLKWEMKLQDFDYLEFKFLFNDKEEIEGISYRLNQAGKFTDPLTLKHKAKSVHKFGKKRGKHQFTRNLYR